MRGKDVVLFTYDVYMDIVRLHRYVPSARQPKLLKLPNYKLTFPMHFGPAGSGLPSLSRAEGDEVWGLGYRIFKDELAAFGRKLNIPNRYYFLDVRATDRANDRLAVKTYAISIPDDPNSRPSKSKLSELVNVAKNSGLPDDYVTLLASYQTME